VKLPIVSVYLVAAVMSDSAGPPDLPWEQYRTALRIIARRKIDATLRRLLDSSDLVQQTLTNAVRFEERLREIPDDAQRLAYLRVVMANILVDKHRAHRREPALADALKDSSVRVAGGVEPPERLALENEALANLISALGRLAEDEQTAIRMRYLDEPPATLAKIAAALNRSPSATARLLARALRQLREYLGANPWDSDQAIP
jgi:RNA polymerase sigma factor (sigma-70 family)